MPNRTALSESDMRKLAAGFEQLKEIIVAARGLTNGSSGEVALHVEIRGQSIKTVHVTAFADRRISSRIKGRR